MRIDITKLDWDKALHYTRAGFDDVLDYIPFVSMINAIVDGFQKFYWKRNHTELTNHYQIRISKKHKGSLIGLAIPGVNIIVALARDILAYRKTNRDDNVHLTTQDLPNDDLTVSNNDAKSSFIKSDNDEDVSESDHESDEIIVNQIPNEENINPNVGVTVKDAKKTDHEYQDFLVEFYADFYRLLSQFFDNIPSAFTVSNLENASLKDFYTVKLGWANYGVRAALKYQVKNGKIEGNSVKIDKEIVDKMRKVNTFLSAIYNQKLFSEYKNNKVPTNETKNFLYLDLIGNVLVFVNLFNKNEDATKVKRDLLLDLVKRVNDNESVDVPDEISFLLNLDYFESGDLFFQTISYYLSNTKFYMDIITAGNSSFSSSSSSVVEE